MRITTSAPVDRAAGRLATASADAVLPALWRARGRPLDEYVAVYDRFYALVARLHKTSAFVDGSKSWRKVAVLAPRLEREVRVLHLVRDPRGFLASWRRNLGDDDDPRAALARRENLANEYIAGNIRQAEVRKHDVELPRSGNFYGLTSAAGGDDIRALRTE